MKYSGPLGAPRLTNFGPLVAQPEGTREELSSSAANTIVEDVAEENDIPANDLSEEEAETLIRGVADRVYPPDEPVPESKNARFRICMKERWANAWADGLAESDKVDITFENDLEKAALMAQGCVGITEAQTANHENIIPENFKR